MPLPADNRTLAELRFTIDARVPATRHVAITLECDASVAASRDGEVVLFLPTWTPGSYLIREYSRHLGRVTAEDAATGASISCSKIAKNRFAMRPAAGVRRIRIRYSVHAHELSVRTADLTADHAYWNPACLLLWPILAPHAAARIEVLHPDGWDIACALPQSTVDAARDRTTLLARDLDHAIDSPCLVGRFERLTWTELGVPHEVVLDGLGAVRAPENLVTDLGAIVRTAAAVFGGSLPYERYSFLCLFAADGHGGLEHRDSTTLLMARTALQSEKAYREFLSLAAHELFHAWNVKRMRPVEFWRYDYENENYTSLLWLIEGWTAYYDDLICLRAGRMKVEDYLGIVARNLGQLRNAPGRFRLSLSESSFDAWIRLYRPDENTRNSSQNYYVHGALAAMCLDLTIRARSAGRHCLDDVMHRLYGSTFEAGRGYSIADVEHAVAEVAGDEAVAAMNSWTNGVLDPDFEKLLQPFGVRLVVKDTERPFLGLSFDSGKTTLASVQADSPGHFAGLAPGDEILAVQNLRVDADRWQEVFLAVAKPGAPVELLIARRGEIRRITAVPTAGPGTPSLDLVAEATAEQLALRSHWLPGANQRPRAAAATNASAN